MAVVLAIVVAVLAFLLGSIPWGVIISRVVYGKDIRAEGSGNIGTTNAMRSLGKAGGAAVFLLDFGKGLLAGFIGQQCASIAGNGDVYLAQVFVALAFLFAILGHVFSPWLGFKGGKGIAVAVGCLFFSFGPVGALAELALFAVLVIATRYVSVGSLAAAIACPFFSLYYFWGNPLAWLLSTAGALVVIWAHRGNIQRLLAGEERRIGSKSASRSES